MFGFPKRGSGEIHHQPPADEPTAAETSTTVELIRLRHLINDLTTTALREGRDTDLAIDLRRGANLPMPSGSQLGPVREGGEGGSR